MGKAESYKYWVVECCECQKPIPLRRYHAVEGEPLPRGWPKLFKVPCPNCKSVHEYDKIEISPNPVAFDAMIPQAQLPTFPEDSTRATTEPSLRQTRLG